MAQNEKQNQNVPAPNPTDRVAAARAQAEAYLAGTQEQTGTCLGLSADHVPYWFVPAEVGAGRADAIRRDLLARGYAPAPQAQISGVGNAEVYEIPREVAAMLDARRTQKNKQAIWLANRDVSVKA